jgi:hypothetical protein
MSHTLGGSEILCQFISMDRSWPSATRICI